MNKLGKGEKTEMLTLWKSLLHHWTLKVFTLFLHSNTDNYLQNQFKILF